MLFRHKNQPPAVTVASPASSDQDQSNAAVDQTKAAPSASVKPSATPEQLRELMEKNLKWSQIIYEQNRRINRKLIWSAVAGWLKFLLIVVIPLALGVLYLPPLIRQYQGLLSGGGKAGSGAASWEQVLKLLPLNPAQQEQFKTILKSQ